MTSPTERAGPGPAARPPDEPSRAEPPPPDTPRLDSSPGDRPAPRPLPRPDPVAEVPRLPQLPAGPARRRTASATAALAALLCAGAYAGTGAMVAVALVAVAALGYGWPALLALPSPRGTSALVAVGGLLCVLSVGLTRDEPLLEWLALALAGSVLAEFVHQLARRDGRPRMVESSTGALAGVMVLASMSAWLAVPHTPAGAPGVLVTVVPVTAALLVQLVPAPVRVTSALGSGAAVLVGAVLGQQVAEATLLGGALGGGLAAVVALLLHRLLVVLPAAGWRPGWLALAVAPLASGGMVAYVLVRLLIG